MATSRADRRGTRQRGTELRDTEVRDTGWGPRIRRGTRTVALASVVAVGAALALPGGTALADDDYADCGAGAVVIVAGTNDRDAASLIGVEQRYTGLGPNNQPDPNSDYQDGNQAAYKVIKPQFPTSLWPLGSVGYNDDVARGTDATLAAIAEYQTQCPDKPVVVAGYSQGARIAGDVLHEIGTGSDDGDGRREVTGSDGTVYAIDPAGVSGELYSDPRRDGPETGRGIELQLVGVIPGLTMTGARPGGFGDVPVTTYCYEGDPICDLPDPLHDPFGALDGVIGYFNKHGYYPWRMYRPVTGWDCSETPSAEQVGSGYVDCVVAAPTASALLWQGIVDDVRETLGLQPRQVADLWSLLPNLNGIFPHANLGDLQQYITPVMNLFPPLPQLGYGAYLPNLFDFRNLAHGLVTFDPEQFLTGVQGLGASAVSIALYPVNFVRYWVGEIVDVLRPAVNSPTTTGGTVLALALDVDEAALADALRNGPAGEGAGGLERDSLDADPDGVDVKLLDADEVLPPTEEPGDDPTGDGPTEADPTEADPMGDPAGTETRDGDVGVAQQPSEPTDVQPSGGAAPDEPVTDPTDPVDNEVVGTNDEQLADEPAVPAA